MGEEGEHSLWHYRNDFNGKIGQLKVFNLNGNSAGVAEALELYNEGS